MVDLSSAEVLVSCARKLKILSEQHDFESSVCTVTAFFHIENKVLQSRVNEHHKERR